VQPRRAAVAKERDIFAPDVITETKSPQHDASVAGFQN
jgi:hypothetical protein